MNPLVWRKKQKEKEGKMVRRISASLVAALQIATSAQAVCAFAAQSPPHSFRHCLMDMRLSLPACQHDRRTREKSSSTKYVGQICHMSLTQHTCVCCTHAARLRCRSSRTSTRSSSMRMLSENLGTELKVEQKRAGSPDILSEKKSQPAKITPAEAERRRSQSLTARQKNALKKQVHDNMPAGMFLGKEAAKEQKVLAARALQRELGLEGIFAVNKPSNWSSFDMVLKARNTLQRVFRAADPEMPLKYGQIKIGHGGTLDPLATGVLVVGVGRGTKLIDHFIAGKKVYEGVVRLGFETSTGDLEGEQLGEEQEWRHVTEDMIHAACASFIGDIMQVPPAYSALMIEGRRAYELAREGHELELKPRPVIIYSIELLAPYAHTAPDIHLRVTCGGGTYIRSIARDLGRALESAAHLTRLVRTKHGDFGLSDAISHEHLDMPGRKGNASAVLASMRDNDAAFLRLLTADNTAEDGHKRFLPSVGGTGAVAQRCNYCSGGFHSKRALFRHLRGENACAVTLAASEKEQAQQRSAEAAVEREEEARGDGADEDADGERASRASASSVRPRMPLEK